MRQILLRVNSVICTPKNSNRVRSQYIRPGKQILPKQNNPVAHLHHLYFIRLIHSLSNHSVGATMDNWTAPKYNFMKHTIVLGGSQFTHCIPLSKREAKIKKTSGQIFCVGQVYFTSKSSKSWRQIWWRINQPFKIYFF